MEEVHTIGLVREGKFFPLDRKDSVEVTETGLVEATTPTPMNLAEYEGKVIMISGQDNKEGGMIFGVKIEDVANPILSTIALKVFNKL